MTEIDDGHEDNEFIVKHTCSICLDKAEEKHLLKTKCNHFFHSECLFNWIIQDKTQKTLLKCYDDIVPLKGYCPMCRNQINQIFDIKEHSTFKSKRKKFFINLFMSR